MLKINKIRENQRFSRIKSNLNLIYINIKTLIELCKYNTIFFHSEDCIKVFKIYFFTFKTITE